MKNLGPIALSVFTLLLVSPASTAWAHKGHHHESGDIAAPRAQPKPEQASAVTQIAQSYAQTIEPLFKRACMDCHSDRTVFPWYYEIPGIKQFMDSDIREGREHLDLSKGYPFISHATPVEDLEEIGEEVGESGMPPFFYRLMHKEARLTAEEKKVIQDWCASSKELLKSSNNSMR